MDFVVAVVGLAEAAGDVETDGVDPIIVRFRDNARITTRPGGVE